MAMRRVVGLIVFTALALSFMACGRKTPPVMPKQSSNIGGGGATVQTSVVKRQHPAEREELIFRFAGVA